MRAEVRSVGPLAQRSISVAHVVTVCKLGQWLGQEPKNQLDGSNIWLWNHSAKRANNTQLALATASKWETSFRLLYCLRPLQYCHTTRMPDRDLAMDCYGKADAVSCRDDYYTRYDEIGCVDKLALARLLEDSLSLGDSDWPSALSSHTRQRVLCPSYRRSIELQAK